mmetsp:Transcript_17006/g.37025  ORF Transcript_17006/g.37025 Transcript_17006/m.37025 type:complete len:578 (-) Transcript_17006:34-1767(-)
MNRVGRRGDPRMKKALRIKRSHPELSSSVILRLGGYDYPDDADLTTRDSDGVTLRQRKNQLCRRWRMESTRRQQHKKQKLEGDGCAVGYVGDDEAGSVERNSNSVSAHHQSDDSSSSSDVSMSGLSGQQTITMHTQGEDSDPIDENVMDSNGVGHGDDTDDGLSPALLDTCKMLLPSQSPSPASPADPMHKSSSEDSSSDDGQKENEETESDFTDNLIKGEIFCGELSSLTPQEISDANADVRGTRQRESYLLKRLLHVSNAIWGSNGDIHDTYVTAAMAFMNADDARGIFSGSFFEPVLHDLILRMKRSVLAETAQGEACALEAFLRMDSERRRVEFGNRRLELFLRREGMDPTQAAARFVRYWKKRKELFGTDNYHLPLTATCALKDDVSSLEFGRFVILPEPDKHGRTVMLYTETRGAYNGKSLLRAMFCAMESAMDLPSSLNGVVWLSWDKDVTVWSYDRSFYEELLGLEQTYLPIEASALHCCCCPRDQRNLIELLVLTCLDRRMHARLRVHFDTDNGNSIADILEEYGIEKNALPTFMGGTVDVANAYRKWLLSMGTNLLCWPEQDNHDET